MALPDITLEGRLTADPELRFTPSGKAVANASVACNDRVKNADGSWGDGDPTFLRITAWGRLGENLCESAVKGDLVVVKGRLKQETYEKDGEKRTVYNVTADTFAVSLAANASPTPRARGEAAPPRPDSGPAQAAAAGWGEPAPAPASDVPPF